MTTLAKCSYNRFCLAGSVLVSAVSHCLLSTVRLSFDTVDDENTPANRGCCIIWNVFAQFAEKIDYCVDAIFTVYIK